MISSSLQQVALSLGANLGEREETLTKAVQMLTERSILLNHQTSSLYETAPVGVENQPRFLNICIVGTTPLQPIAFHRTIKSLESEIGRKPREQWHEREIDIDILLYGKVILETNALTIPHPRMHERRFVLEPLAEIAPFLTHPAMYKSVDELLHICTDMHEVVKLND